MSKLELDDQILNHTKFVRARKSGGSEAIDLWLGIRAYCGQNLSNGFVPEDMVDDVRGPLNAKKRSAALDVLRDVALVHTVKDGRVLGCDKCNVPVPPDGFNGFVMHDYLQWSRSKSQVIADRKRARERQAKSRGVSRSDSGGSNGGGHAGSSGSVTMASASASASASADHTKAAGAAPPDPLRDALTIRPEDELPDGWLPNGENVALCVRLGLTLDDELGEYRAWCRRERRVCGAWDSDFELWLRRSKKFARERAAKRSDNGKAEPAQAKAEELTWR